MRKGSGGKKEGGIGERKECRGRGEGGGGGGGGGEKEGGI